jgi:hypothetical protein
MFAIITVLQLPPNESFNNLVNFESLYGMKLFLFYPPLAPVVISHNALIQFPKANKLLLILAPSTNLNPLLFVLLALSLPAKSIRLNLAIFISA